MVVEWEEAQQRGQPEEDEDEEEEGQQQQQGCSTGVGGVSSSRSSCSPRNHVRRYLVVHTLSNMQAAVRVYDVSDVRQRVEAARAAAMAEQQKGRIAQEAGVGSRSSSSSGLAESEEGEGMETEEEEDEPPCVSPPLPLLWTYLPGDEVAGGTSTRNNSGPDTCTGGGGGEQASPSAGGGGATAASPAAAPGHGASPCMPAACPSPPGAAACGFDSNPATTCHTTDGPASAPNPDPGATCHACCLGAVSSLVLQHGVWTACRLPRPLPHTPPPARHPPPHPSVQPPARQPHPRVDVRQPHVRLPYVRLSYSSLTTPTTTVDLDLERRVAWRRQVGPGEQKQGRHAGLCAVRWDADAVTWQG